MDITALPFNQLIGLTRSEREGALLSLPGDVRYTNHLGTIHAGALLALAENTSGECLLREFREVGFAVVPVVRRLESKFRNPAHGRIHGSAVLVPEAKARFLQELTNKGRAFIDVAVEVCDDGGAPVMSATVGWFIARRA
jgi:acyl-coenzyme A thioesterase PaaI-like protein